MTDLTNSAIVAKAPDVFDNLGAYQVPMAGRREELATLIASVEATEPTITLVSAPLGSGKTFLLNQCFGTLLPKGFDDNRNRYTVQASKVGRRDQWKAPLSEVIAARLEGADTRFRRVCIVEELDRKSKFGILEAVVDEAVKWLESEPTGCLILTGDRFLEHPVVQARVTVRGIPNTDVRLATLDRPLMLEAIALRINQIVFKRDEDFSSALLAAEALLSDPAVENCVIPPTSPAISNFREAFGLLRRLSDCVDLTVSGIDFGNRFLRGLTSPRELMAEQRITEEFIVSIARESVRAGDQVSEISLGSLLNRSRLEYSEDEFRKRVVDTLVRHKCLVPMGIPYFVNGSFSDTQYVGPYLPKQDIFIEVAAELSADGL